jgi:uncharacterized membrane protein YhaH (DUF805 family)
MEGNKTMKLKISDLWRWDGTINRSAFVLWGVLLFVVKCGLDCFLSAVIFHESWSVFDYLGAGVLSGHGLPSSVTRVQLATLLAVSLPFLWAGVGLTLRRLRSAGLPLWLVVLFVLPAVKVLFFGVLCLMPPRSQDVPGQSGNKEEGKSWDAFIPKSELGSALMAVAMTVGLSSFLVWLGTELLSDYGVVLFVGLPFAMGFCSVLIYGSREPRGLFRCLMVGASTIAAAWMVLLLLPIEGLLCLVMVAPLALGMSLVGAAAAYAIQAGYRHNRQSPKLFCAVVGLVPVLMGAEHWQPPAAPLLEVKSSVEINAPPEVVWRHVISFPRLASPSEWLFHTGIAYPIQAEIRGRGRGAVRYCEFSTGAFVEPIEVWDEPRLLRFSVTANPPPMQEWSPYQGISPPHLHGFLVAKQGQFELVPVSGGRTRLEGTTWYYHRVWPVTYWRVWSDYIIHHIHLLVLQHVKQLAENDNAGR